MIIGLIILTSISIFLYGLLQADLSNNEKYEKNNLLDENKLRNFEKTRKVIND